MTALGYDGQSYRRRSAGLLPVEPGYHRPQLGRSQRLYSSFRTCSLLRFLTGKKDLIFFPFVKQSLALCHCGLPSLSREQALLLANIRSRFADFPRLGSPNTPLPSRQAYLCRFSVRSWGILAFSLFTGSRNQQNFAYAKPFLHS